MTLKMKLVPEINCLEAQEKFWRGKLREISQKYDEDKRKLEDLLHLNMLENEQLKKELQTLKVFPQKSSTGIQTDIQTEIGGVNENVSFCRSEPVIERDSESLTHNEEYGKEDRQSVMKYEENNDSMENDFSSNVNDKFETDISTDELDVFTEKLLLNNSPKHIKRVGSNKFLPAKWNIRVKVMKNIFKIKQTYTSIKFRKNKLKINIPVCNNDVCLNEDLHTDENVTDSLQETSIQNKTIDDEDSSKKGVLISAMKKAKSSENIIKKVAFADDFHKEKMSSESDLQRIEDSNRNHQRKLLVGSVYLHCDRFAKPIPAPRAKKNIILTNE